MLTRKAKSASTRVSNAPARSSKAKSAPTRASKASVANKADLDKLRQKVEERYYDAEKDKTIFTMMDRAANRLKNPDDANFFMKITELSKTYFDYGVKLVKEMVKNGTFPKPKNITKDSDYFYFVRFAANPNEISRIFWDLYKEEKSDAAEFVKQFMEVGIPVPQKVLDALLHYAAEYRMVELGELCLKAGANPHSNSKDDLGNDITVLDRALWGHRGWVNYYILDSDKYKDVLKFWDMLKKYDPKPIVSEEILNVMQEDDWPGLRNRKYRQMVGLEN